MSSNELQEFNPKQVNQNGVVWFDSRDIHFYVENQRQFADWIKQRIAEIGAVEGVDYLIHKFVKQVDGPILNR